MFEPVRGGTRGGQAEFKWSDVSADKDRENYLGHSINAPTGRWQKNKDIHWYNRDVSQEESERLEEIRKIKEMEADALAVALGFEPSKKTVPNADSSSPAATSSNAIAISKTESQKALEKEESKRKKAERKEEKRAKREQKRARSERHTINDHKHDERRRARGRSRSASPRRRSQDPLKIDYDSRRPRSRSRSRTPTSIMPDHRHSRAHRDYSPTDRDHRREREVNSRNDVSRHIHRRHE